MAPALTRLARDLVMSTFRNEHGMDTALLASVRAVEPGPAPALGEDEVRAIAGEGIAAQVGALRVLLAVTPEAPENEPLRAAVLDKIERMATYPLRQFAANRRERRLPGAEAFRIHETRAAALHGLIAGRPSLAPRARAQIAGVIAGQGLRVLQSGAKTKLMCGGELALTEAGDEPSVQAVRLPEIRVSGDRIRFLVFGDTGAEDPAGRADQLRLAEAMRKRNQRGRLEPHFSIHTGDLIYPDGVTSPDDPRLETALRAPYDLDAGRPDAAGSERTASGPGQRKPRPLYLAAGNHDHGHHEFGDVGAVLAFARRPSHHLVMPAPCYSFRYRCDHDTTAEFFVVDTTTLPCDEAQLAWLSRELDRSDAHWRVVVGHHPIVSCGTHPSHKDSPSFARTALADLLKAKGVQLYLCGHDHNIQVLREDGPQVIVSGAGYQAKATSSGSHHGIATEYRTQEAGELGFVELALGAGMVINVLGVRPDEQGGWTYANRKAIGPEELPAARLPAARTSD